MNQIEYVKKRIKRMKGSKISIDSVFSLPAQVILHSFDRII
jgi:hypothetical protein